MSWRRPATSSRSGRRTPRTSAAACTAVSSRCRSTLKRCTALRCGRWRTAAHSGNNGSIRPAWSRASQTCTSGGPAPIRSTNASRAGRRPRLGQRHAVGREPVDRAGREWQAGAGGAGSHPQHQAGVGGRVRLCGQHRLAVVLGQARSEQPEHRAATAEVARARRAGHLVGPPPGDLGRVRHRRRGPDHLAEQGVGVGDVQPGGHLVLFLQQQAVARTAGHQMEGVADVGQSAYGVVDVAVRTVGDPGGDDRAQGHQVAQPAPAFLEVGLDVVAQVAVPGAAVVPGLPQRRQPAAGRCSPVGEDGGAQPAHQARVARDVAGVEQAEQDGEILPGQPTAFVDRAHRVVEAHARVPDRVPDLVCQRGDRARAGVEQDEVEVAAGRELAPPVPADCCQRDPAVPVPRRCAGRGKDVTDPRVGEGGQRLPARETRPSRSREQVASLRQVVPRPRGPARLWLRRIRERRRHAHRCAPAPRRPPASTTPCRRRSSRSASS